MDFLTQLFSHLDWSYLLIGGFSLFGSSGDKTTSNTSTNVTNDTTTTTTDSNNITTNTANTLNAALTRNSSFISNDSKVQNTALQLTDSFNRFVTNNLANVGNTTIGGSGAPPVSDYGEFFKNAPQQTLRQTDLAQLRPLLDFNSLSLENARALAGITSLNGSIQSGFAANVKATGESAANINPGVTSSGMTTKIIIAAAAVLIAFIFFRRK